MDLLTIILDFVVNQGIWCALFVWLFYTSRNESVEREAKLTGVIEEQGERLGLISNTLVAINERLDRVESKLFDEE